ncbi:histidine kinase [Nocardiopsis sp. N85]|uniref:sensor histidine kinase n=1 Tax=Nocardiopsis sp. N85 TaxID=3029400 RepID=UPI00237F41B6|nr:histidine kinase [Nocardiopsis sp. N85]MDE3722519.1 histidine kinase [Nocardiopsis sp. N85]
MGQEQGTARTALLSFGLTSLFTALLWREWAWAIEDSALPRGVTLIAACGYLLGCAALAPAAPLLRWTARIAVCALLIALGCGLVAAVGPEHAWITMFGLAACAAVLPLPLSLGATALVLAGVGAASSATGGAEARVGDLVIIASVSVATALAVRLVEANAELRRGRDQAAQLAVLRERERLSRDLHDLLGHSLTTIVVKAGAGRRILETTGDTARAVAELRDLEDLGRRSLTEVREAVSGVRRVGLAGELLRAEAVLAAADIELRAPAVAETGNDEALGYAVREAITNVVRHSRASRVEITTGPGWVRVRDDGHADRVVPGGGLSGLERRLAERGGALTLSPTPGGGLTVRAEVPVDESGERT